MTHHTSDQLVNRHLNTKYLVFLFVQFLSTPTHFSGQVSGTTTILPDQQFNTESVLLARFVLREEVTFQFHHFNLICKFKMSIVQDADGQLILDRSIHPSSQIQILCWV